MYINIQHKCNDYNVWLCASVDAAPNDFILLLYPEMKLT